MLVKLSWTSHTVRWMVIVEAPAHLAVRSSGRLPRWGVTFHTNLDSDRL